LQTKKLFAGYEGTTHLISHAATIYGKKRRFSVSAGNIRKLRIES